jgi:hypothetical protein
MISTHFHEFRQKGSASEFKAAQSCTLPPVSAATAINDQPVVLHPASTLLLLCSRFAYALLLSILLSLLQSALLVSALIFNVIVTHEFYITPSFRIATQPPNPSSHYFLLSLPPTHIPTLHSTISNNRRAPNVSRRPRLPSDSH